MLPVLQWAIGPGLIVLQIFLQLAPKFVVSNALLVAGRGAEELMMRRSLAESIVVVMVLDMAWNYVRPSGVTQHTAGVLLLLASTLTAANTFLAFNGDDAGDDGGFYTPSVAFWLQFVAGALTIPVNQHAALWRLGEVRSPVRMHVFGWLLTVGLSTITLLVPSLATAVPIIISSAAFPMVVGLALIIMHNHAWDPANVGSATAQAAAARRKQSASLSVSLWPTTVHYLLLAIACGTNAEAINDMATGLMVRAEQLKGKSDICLLYTSDAADE